MQWHQLISDRRFGLEDYNDTKPGLRSDFRRDYDRLVFSSPFRRLQNKTQVFPLPGSIFVHNRLTHSLEVSSVGRSLANEVTWRLADRYQDTRTRDSLFSLGDIVAAACLAHDMGNPPFGHSGEKAISTYFSEGAGRVYEDSLTPRQWADLVHFDGNANAFRLLTHTFNGRRPGGFAMTYSTLASIVKYPYTSLYSGSKNKFGFFDSEAESFAKVAGHLGIIKYDGGEPRYARHPLVYVVEAADDICYEVMDIEDAHKLGLISTDEATELFTGFFEGASRERRVRSMRNIADPNERLAYLRSCVIGALVDAAADVFADNEEAILAGEFRGALLDHLPEVELEGYRRCTQLSWNKIYCAPDVVDIELAGNRIITFLLENMIKAVMNPGLNYSRLLLSKFPSQYQIDGDTVYSRIQGVLDHLTGMTDVYALDLYRKLNGMSLKINN